MLLESLKKAPQYERRALLQEYIRSTVGAILQRETAKADSRQKLFELGLRSLDLVELKTRLEDAFSVALPVTLFFSYSAVDTLADHLLTDVLRLDGRAPDIRSEIATPAAPPSLEWEQVGRMSEEEAAAALLARISDLEAT